MKKRQKKSLRPFFFSGNLKGAALNLRYRWMDMGPFNQLLIIFAFLCLFSMSITSYIVILNHYQSRAVKCLALNIYHEARGESISGQTAVASVTMNRVQSHKYPNDVCLVVFQKNWSRKYKRYISHFSWTDFDDYNNIIPKEDKAWYVATGIAEKVYKENFRSEKTKGALHYHANYVKPTWAKNKKIIAKIGQHIFYQ